MRCPGRRFDHFRTSVRRIAATESPEAKCLPSSVCRAAVCLLGRFPALAGVDLDASTGEIVLLSGANGAGKTTLLRLLAGLVPLYSGEAVVLDHDLAVDRKGARRDLALVGHETFCYDDLTVRENLHFAAKAAGREDGDADTALERLGLARQADVVHRRLSMGQRRRLAVAVALSRDPRLLLLDEPHAGLDAEGREVLDDVVRAAPSEARTCWWRPTSSTTRGSWRPARSSSPPARPSWARSSSRCPTWTSRPIGASRDGGGVTLWREVRLVAGKDLRIEARTRVTAQQIVPFGLIVLLLFAFALDPDRGILRRVAPGLFWVTVLLAALLAVSRSFSIEADNGARDGLRLSGLDGPALFLGKAAAIAVQLLALEVVLAATVVLVYGIELNTLVPLVLATLAATVGVAATGTLYGVLAAGVRVRETLVPVLLLPVVAPVLLGATRAWEAAIDGIPSDAWPWVALLAVFALLFTAIGMLAFGPLLEEA